MSHQHAGRGGINKIPDEEEDDLLSLSNGSLASPAFSLFYALTLSLSRLVEAGL